MQTRWLAASVVILGVATGCALRPMYRDVVGVSKATPGAASEVSIRVVEEKSGEPVPGATLRIGENPRTRVVRTTDARGMTTLPINTALVAENSLVVVTLPPGFGRYRIERLEQMESTVEPPPAPPVDEVPDAGTSEPVMDESADAGTSEEAADAGM